MSKKRMEILKWTMRGFGISIVGVLTFVFISLHALGQSDEETIKNLQAAGLELIEEEILYDSTKVYVVRIGDISKPKILFVHGSPGDWTVFDNIYLNKEISDKYCLIVYDRPGYGGTKLVAEPVLKIQANVAKHIMDAFGANEKFIVVCHSYGGGVVSQMLVDYPDQIKKAVLAAPALAPEQQEPRWYNKVAKWKIVNWFIGDQMRASNVEMLGLAPSLREIEDSLYNIDVPIVFIHGERDGLVPFETVEYWKKHSTCTCVTYVLKKKMGHLIPFKHPELIIDGILN